MDFIEAVKNARFLTKVSQAEIGRNIGKTRAWISLVETERAGFSAKTRNEIAEALYKHIDRVIDVYQEKITVLCQAKIDLEDALNG